MLFYACNTLWQYGLWSFQTEGTQLERFLPKNQHAQRKLLNFENWFNIASGSEANMTTLCEMEFFNFLWLIMVHYLPLPPTSKDRPPRPP